MKIFKNSASFLTILLVVLACCTDETEARRRILRGRRIITRTYNRGLAIPGWAIIVLVALGEVLVGVILYFAMNKFVLSSTVSNANTYTPALQNDV